MVKKWIQHAKIKKGSLKGYLKKEAPSLLDKDNKIKYREAKEWYNKHKDKLSTTTQRRFNLYFNLRKISKKK